jgi:hypothetical protein
VASKESSPERHIETGFVSLAHAENAPPQTVNADGKLSSAIPAPLAAADGTVTTVAPLAASDGTVATAALLVAGSETTASTAPLAEDIGSDDESRFDQDEVKKNGKPLRF